MKRDVVVRATHQLTLLPAERPRVVVPATQLQQALQLLAQLVLEKALAAEKEGIDHDD
jgi:hypothetical protein